MVLVKNWKFFVNVSFYAKYTQKKYLVTFSLEKKPLKTIKTTVYEKRTVRIFPRGLVHCFGPDIEISSTLIFMQNRPRKSIWERSS